MIARLLCLLTLCNITPFVIAADNIQKAEVAIIIDGKANDEAWQRTNWAPMPYLMAGTMPTANDFSGRYKLLWDEKQLYILAEITDDVLYDQYPDPKELYWDDDALEIFIDEDMSGGIHQFDHNAFAYHVALDGQAPDIGGPNLPDGSLNVVLLNDHLETVWKRSPGNNKIIWEVALRLYPDDFTPDKPGKPIPLFAGKKIGFMLAYCDNDGSKTREHFLGSHDITPVKGDKNRGYIDASVFGQFVLVD